MSQDLDVNKLSLGSSSNEQSPKLKYETLTSSMGNLSHPQLNSDIQARLLAFQQKRTNKNLQLEEEKPLPPLPNQTIRSFSANDSNNYSDTAGNTTGSVPSPGLNGFPHANGSQSPLVSSQSPDLSDNSSTDLSKKPSLSQRRNLKLNINDLKPSHSPDTLSPPVPDHHPALLNSTGELNRRLSSRKKKHNFKLNLDEPDDKSKSSGSDDQQQPKLQGLFANYSKYVDIKSGSLNFRGKASLHSQGIDFSSGTSFHISLDQLQYIEELGRGNYGTVSKVLHKPTGVLMAMKEVRLELDENKFTQILMELEVLHNCHSPYIVDFYGAFFVEGAVYMCIECMEGGSLNKIYEKDVGIENEAFLAYITESTIRGLKELKDNHNIIHRDVKPTNILVNRFGKIKLCDFGVSGNLVASLAKTNIGCQSYMAPERIKSLNPDDSTYSIQSDIWSLGLTILEIAKGNYPYPAETYDNIFSQLSAMVDGEPPKLDSKKYSKEAQGFVKSCLNKNPDLRPSYQALLNHPWLVKYRDVGADGFDKYVNERIEAYQSEVVAGKNRPKENVSSLLKTKVKAPALHRGGLFNMNQNKKIQGLRGEVGIERNV